MNLFNVEKNLSVMDESSEDSVVTPGDGGFGIIVSICIGAIFVREIVVVRE